MTSQGDEGFGGISMTLVGSAAQVGQLSGAAFGRFADDIGDLVIATRELDELVDLPAAARSVDMREPRLLRQTVDAHVGLQQAIDRLPADSARALGLGSLDNQQGMSIRNVNMASSSFDRGVDALTSGNVGEAVHSGALGARKLSRFREQLLGDLTAYTAQLAQHDPIAARTFLKDVLDSAGMTAFEHRASYDQARNLLAILNATA